MHELEAKQIIAMLSAAYPSWKAGEDTLNLYEAILLPLEAVAVRETVMELIRSPREFPPPVGAIYTAAKIETERIRADRAVLERTYEPGLLAYTPGGQRMQAGADGRLRPVEDPPPRPITADQRTRMQKIIENLGVIVGIRGRKNPALKLGEIVAIGERPKRDG